MFELPVFTSSNPVFVSFDVFVTLWLINSIESLFSVLYFVLLSINVPSSLIPLISKY